MARFEVGGIDELTEQLKRTGQLTGAMAEEMIRAGSQVLVRTWQEVIRNRGHVETGDMVSSVRPTKVNADGDGVLGAEVYPQGKDRKGVRNAEKAFILHYGWSGKLGDHFVDEIAEQAKAGVAAAMEYQMDMYLQRSEQ